MHLFAQLERLGDEDLKGDALLAEIGRAKTITGVASQIIAGGQLVLKAQLAYEDAIDADKKLPPMLLAGGD